MKMKYNNKMEYYIRIHDMYVFYSSKLYILDRIHLERIALESNTKNCCLDYIDELSDQELADYILKNLFDNIFKKEGNDIIYNKKIELIDFPEIIENIIKFMENHGFHLPI